MEKRQSWSSRLTFILAAVGSAVGLGNAWRFPGLAAKHGGGAFLLVYFIAMLVFGVPLLMMEISIGRKLKKGAAPAMRGINKKFEPIGWAATANAFVIVCYYAVVFAWVILMVFMSYKFAGMTGDAVSASNLFAETIETTWTVKDYGIPLILIIPFLLAWGSIFFCIRNGAQSVGKVVKYTVFLPVVFLVIMAIKGITMPGAMDGIQKLFIPDFAALANPQLWIDAVGQVFYSLSIMMAIMFAYGSYLKEDSNVAVDAVIISFCDIGISILAGVVMFSTMGGVGMLDNMSDSGIVTAFIVYPQAIVSLAGSGVFNAIFGAVFYLCLVTLAIDSAFSIVEGVSASVADRFKLDPRKTTRNIVIIAAVISLIFITRAGLAWLDIVDKWANAYNLIIVGIMECIAIGWFFKPGKVLSEINRNTKKFKMPAWWFITSVKFVAPLLLTALFCWNLYDLFVTQKGNYGGYPQWALFVGGWLITILVMLSGFVVKAIVAAKKKKGFVEEEISWED
ncbi:MAG: sodium-dependent transporter [Lachnospiraceae bacterium]|nr:sodium-dependent transporter [Lachnospiraceae bacterium]